MGLLVGAGGSGNGFSQGASCANFSDFTAFTLTSGAGGTTSTGNGYGGGGGGGVVVDGDTSVKGGTNQANSANGGVGYGGGAGGGSGNSGSRTGGIGANGAVIIEWEGGPSATPIASCVGTTAGTQRVDSGDLQYCDGTNWYSMISSYSAAI